MALRGLWGLRGIWELVSDTGKPVINLTPDQLYFTVFQGDNFAPPTAIATDNRDGDVVVTPVDVDSFDSSVVGTYTFTYDHTDNNNNTANTVVVTVLVVSKLSVGSAFFVPPVDFSLKENQLRWDKKKDPSDIEYYPVELSSWLKGDDAQSALFEPSIDSGLVVEEIGIDGTIAWVLLSGGNEGAHYVDVTVTTDTGRTRQRNIKLRVKNI